MLGKAPKNICRSQEEICWNIKQKFLKRTIYNPWTSPIKLRRKQFKIKKPIKRSLSDWVNPFVYINEEIYKKSVQLGLITLLPDNENFHYNVDNFCKLIVTLDYMS